MSYVVGLTGGIGSGKSTVAGLFVAQGAALVDTDAIAHALTAPGGAAMPAIAAAFGDGVLRADGALDRAAMRARAFAEPAAKARLEGILHPLIRAEADRQVHAASAPYVILAVPLLVESGSYGERCDRILVVDCAEATQLARVVARNGLSAAEVRAIMATQATRAARLAAADDVIDNDGPPSALPAQVERLHRQYLGAALTKVKANC
ncbi:dephospho-CoA kinase [Azospira restricta]|uniref:Dephospho-CoA kinase n=1 Tax=Azospira restricta TaxID=404405 RepID=A0A974SPC3_9RHOO|nr:dephospho-CoA kinase [Azospira restricta]QRJ63987.1 dephospho-CoA kinase [Azospira restricta]